MPESPSLITLQGRPLAPGRGTGVVAPAWEWALGAVLSRVPQVEVPDELGRLAQAFAGARRCLVEARAGASDAAREALDDALHDLGDVVFLADVERLVLDEHLDAPSALAKAVGEVVQLVGAARAADARDLGARVARGLTGAAPTGPGTIVVAHRLTVEDVLGRPAGAITLEEDPRALEVARALGVPVVRVEGVDLPGTLPVGRPVSLDGDRGEVRVLPA